MMDTFETFDITQGAALAGVGVMGLVLLAFSVIGLVGLAYLTQLAFNDKCTAALTANQKNLTRLAAVLLWITVVLSMIGISVRFKSALAHMVMLVLMVLSVIGMVYLTQLAWNKACTAVLTPGQVTMARLAAVLVWISIGMNLMHQGTQLSKLVGGEIDV